MSLNFGTENGRHHLCLNCWWSFIKPVLWIGGQQR